MVTRKITSYLEKLKSQYPVITITGPRQSGKTTLARTFFDDKPYVSLENIDILEYARQDTRGFLAQYENGAIFDEAQRCPELFSYLQQIIDDGPKYCRFILTGSQQFGLRSHITQSLAGRAANCTLLPFSLREWFDKQENVESLDHLLFTGLYPPIYDRKLDPSIWYSNYIQNYIERDVRQLISIQDLRTFQIFIKMCAARCGQLLNLSGLASDCGISVNTAKGWISVLEASYIIFLLQPHYSNFGKRLIKTPKLYFYDTGLLSHLLSIKEPQNILMHSMRGAIFESFVTSEMKKKIFNTGIMDTLYFWRDRSGNEIDVIFEDGETLHAVEIKSGTTISSDFFSSLYKWKELAKEKAGSLFLIYGGNDQQKRTDVQVIPWKQVETL